MSDSDFSFKPMGWLRADFKQKFGTPRQGSLAKNSRASVELAAEWRGRGILEGLEGFSHVWIISYLHLSESIGPRGKIHPPRLGGEKIGILGTRSPHRPNNIGLTLSKIISCRGDDLQLAEVDLVHGTPILDLKPYLASADRPEHFESGWTERVESRTRICEFSGEAQAELAELARTGDVGDALRFQALVEEMLTQDPRPPAYLARNPARFAVWLQGLNVVFEFRSDRFIVTKIEKVVAPSV